MKLVPIVVALATAALLAAGGRSAGVAAQGGLARLAGTSGCISQTAPGEDPIKGCARGIGLLGLAGIAVSTDGLNAYVASYDSNAVASFTRDQSTGALKEQNCVSANGTSGIDGTKGACADGNALAGAGSVAISPDNAFVYATSAGADGIAIFAKGAKGLTEIGCVRSVRTCVKASALSGLSQIALTPDGKNAYAVAAGSDAVVMFGRDVTTGLLTPLGCISDDGNDGVCKTGNALRGADAIVVSPDGKQVYVGTGSSNSVLTFNRDPETGLLGQRGCIMQDAPHPGSCVAGSGLEDVSSLALSPDGRTLYATAYSSSAVAVFARTPSTGALRWIGCESDPGGDDVKDGCGHGHPLGYPERLAVGKDGNHLYVTTESGLTFLQRNAATGALSVSGCLVSEDYWDDDLKSLCQLAPNLVAPYDVALSPDQRNVYVASYESNSLSVLAPGPAISQMHLSKRGILSARVSCPAERAAACSGALALSAGSDVHAAAPYDVQPGAARDVRVLLTPHARRRLALGNRLSALISASDGSRALTPARRLLLLHQRPAEPRGRPH